MISIESVQKNAGLPESADNQVRIHAHIEPTNSYSSIEHFHTVAVEMVDFDGSN